MAKRGPKPIDIQFFVQDLKIRSRYILACLMPGPGQKFTGKKEEFDLIFDIVIRGAQATYVWAAIAFEFGFKSKIGHL